MFVIINSTIRFVNLCNKHKFDLDARLTVTYEKYRSA